MIGRRAPSDTDAALDAACDWIARLEPGDAGDAVAFDAWLDASEANRIAYDRAIAVRDAYGRAAPEILAELEQREQANLRTRARRPALFAAGALAASAAVAAALLVWQPSHRAPQTQAFATEVGQRNTVRLADGTVVDLNARTRLTVAYAKDARRVTLQEGEAVFDVAHDPARPFLIAAGDRTVRVVGTRFDVRRRDGRLAVTVERGVVEVRPAPGADGPAYRLHPGQRLTGREGAPAVELSAASPEEIASWREGKLVFHDQPLSEVIAELNLQLHRPIQLEDPALGATRVSGVVNLDDEDAVVRRLALLAPVSPINLPNGVLLRRQADR